MSEVHYALRAHVFVDRNMDYNTDLYAYKSVDYTVNILVIVLLTTKVDYIREETSLHAYDVHYI